MPQKYTEARKAGNRKWDAANLDRISVAAPKGTKERWKSAAMAHDKSLNQLIVEVVDHQISQDRDKDTCEAKQSPSGGEGIILTHYTIKAAQEAAEAAGEAVPAFIDRAITTQAQRDEIGRKMKGGKANE